MIKNILGLLIISSLNLYSNVCNTKNLSNRTQVHSAQQCLKAEIAKSIRLAKEYNSYYGKVQVALGDYVKLNAQCKKSEMLMRNSSSSYDRNKHSNDLDYCRKKRKGLAVKYRQLENQYGYIDSRFIDFKKQIILLGNELELIEASSSDILNNY